MSLTRLIGRVRSLQRLQRSVALSCRSGPTDLGGLLDCIPGLSPRFEVPRHLAPVAESLERASAGEALRLVVHTPPRHGKTELLLHGIAWYLRRHPERTVAYVGYGAEFARSKSRRARMLALAAGVRLADDAHRLEEWRTTAGGGLLATGVGGPLTGHGCHLLLVDDPVKNRVEAESATYRARTAEWFDDVAFTRLEPGGAAIVVHTRWHPDDLAGRLLAQGWRSIRLPALDDEGRALWGARFPVAALQRIREQVGEYTWASLYQGIPRPRGGAVFGDVVLGEGAPAAGLKIAIGVDLAYTAKTHADYSVALALGLEGDPQSGRVHVLDVQRRQCSAPDFSRTLQALRERHPGARMRWYAAGTEKGAGDFLRAQGLPLDAVAPHGDKFTRALPVAAAWNAGRVVVPRGARWAEEFVAELAAFTGVDDAQDDQVDALAAGFDLLCPAVAPRATLSLGDGAGLTRATPWAV